MLIPTLMLIFSVAGAAFGIEEETLPFFPVLIPIFIAAGYDSLVGLSVIKIGAALGVMASIANPFAVAIASKFAGISMADGIGIRIILLCIYIPTGIIFTMHYAKKIQKDPTKSLVYAQAEENKKFFLGNGFDKNDLPEFTLKTETHPDRIRIILPYHDLGRTVLGNIPGVTIWPTTVVPGTDCGIPGCKHHSSYNRQNQGMLSWISSSRVQLIY